jgi:hypothetical protein
MSKPNKEFVEDMTTKLRVIQSRLRRREYTDEDLSVLETFLAIGLRVIEKSNTRKLDEAVQIVELRYLAKRVPHVE